MSEPIKAGDLVQVVRPCCSHQLDQTIFVVGEVVPSPCIAFCRGCGHEAPAGTLVARVEESAIGKELAWLKRIPPLSELEDEKQREEIEA